MTSEIGSDLSNVLISCDVTQISGPPGGNLRQESQQFSATERRVPSWQTCIAQNIQSRGDLSVRLPVFPPRGKLEKNTSDDTAATRLENINWAEI